MNTPCASRVTMSPVRSQPSASIAADGLLGHAPVAGGHRGVAQQQLAAVGVVAVVVDDPSLVDDAELGVLPDRSERAEQPLRRAARSSRTGSRTSRSRRRCGGRTVPRSPAGARAPEPVRCSTAAAELSASSGRSRLAHQDLEHRADRVELGGAVAAGRVEESGRREAREQDQPGAAGERAERRVGLRVDVEQRQRRHQPVGRGQLHPVRETLAGHHIGAMRLRHELGASGRARGGDQAGDVVGASPRRWAAARTRRTGRRRPASTSSSPTVEVRPQLAVGDHRLRTASGRAGRRTRPGWTRGSSVPRSRRATRSPARRAGTAGWCARSRRPGRRGAPRARAAQPPARRPRPPRRRTSARRRRRGSRCRPGRARLRPTAVAGSCGTRSGQTSVR